MSHLPLLSRLWLREPDVQAVEMAHAELSLPLADPEELAIAFADLFVLNVAPYGSVFLDPDGELNGPSAETLATRFSVAGFDPIELREVAAPDHLGLCLAFLEERRYEPIDGYDWSWMRACCIAVQREPGVHPFYSKLAETTVDIVPPLPIDNRHATLASPLELRDNDDEVTLGRIVRFFLSPARCGMFLSRGRLGHLAVRIEMRLPFGSRFEVARALFQACGETSDLERLIDALHGEVDGWAAAFRAFGGTSHWHERLALACKTLDQMRELNVARSSG